LPYLPLLFLFEHIFLINIYNIIKIHREQNKNNQKCKEKNTMALAPVIAFNSSPAELGDYFNHHSLIAPERLAEFGKTTIKAGQTSDELSIYISHNHDDEIQDVKFYLTESSSEVSATAISSNSQNYTIEAGVSDKLYLKLDTRTFYYNITFTAGARTAQQICDDINLTVGELIATVSSNKIKLTSPNKGTNSKIYLRNTGSTSLSILGFTGDDTDPLASGSVTGWGHIGNGAFGKCVGSTVTYDVVIVENNNDIIRISLDFASYVVVTIPNGTYTNNTELATAINTGLTNAGWNIISDLVATVSSNIVTITSFTLGDSSSVRVRPGTIHDASTVLGLTNPTETYSDYANTSAANDLIELISWGDSNEGLEIGDSTGGVWTRFETGVGDLQANAIILNWGDGSLIDAISRFNSVSSIEGEVETLLKLSVPALETTTGYREMSIAMEFTYL
jgi:hypothetical protein